MSELLLIAPGKKEGNKVARSIRQAARYRGKAKAYYVQLLSA